MIQKNTQLKVADNSGARSVMCIGLYGGRKVAGVGDIIAIVVKSSVGNIVSKGKVYKGVIVRVKSASRRQCGEVIRFSSNAVVVINDQGDPLGTRVFGPIQKLPLGSFPKIMSLADEVV